MTEHPILVGFDHSPGATAALRWAQDAAARSRAPVRLVYVYEWTGDATPVPEAAGWPDPAVRREAEAAVVQAAAEARAARPEVPLTAAVVDGPAVSTLRKFSEDARLLVVGHRGLGGFTGMLAGSVAVDLATHARSPVVVVRGCARSGQPVVVGVDDAPGAEPALGFAFEEAMARGVDLVAVRAWRPPPVPARYWHDQPPAAYPPRVDIPPVHEVLVAAEQALAEGCLQPWREKYPQLPVHLHLVPHTPAHALVAASADAQLVVVGARGRGGFPGLRLGSVARLLVYHAQCPVAVVRDPTHPTEE
ncbi:MAG TPA: universal stress protein [Natronosporangium sp.]|nr:universal stress protein [Natronosporangium sp.]